MSTMGSWHTQGWNPQHLLYEPHEVSTTRFFSNFTLPATLEDQQSSKQMSIFTSQMDDSPWEAFWVPVFLLSTSFFLGFGIIPKRICSFIYRVSEMTSPRGVPLSLAPPKRYLYLSPTLLSHSTPARERPHTNTFCCHNFPADKNDQNTHPACGKAITLLVILLGKMILLILWII